MQEQGADKNSGQPPDRRRGDGGVYLVIAEESPEFELALRFALRRAALNRGHVGILQVMEDEESMHWRKVEARMARELRAQAEKALWNAARRAHEIGGIMPALYLRDGSRTDAVIETINEDATIRTLVIAGTPGGPGPLVSYFTGKGLAKLRVPVIVVPGGFAAESGAD
jgi:hypothetical protein